LSLTPSLDHLVDAIRETQHEFGPTAIGAEGALILGGPTLDEATRRDMQLRRFRGQAKRAAGETGYYERVFADLDVDPARLGADDIARIPLAPKAALRTDPSAFVRSGAKPVLRTMTTGTTGWPTSVYFSAYELQVIVALSAIGFLTDGQIHAEDIV
jgi:phenylacetate-coenzyme A ligase PaaK-like adenylate-forming protein